MTSQFELAAPDPLKSLTQRVISPANIALEARQKRAEPLTAGKRRQIRQQIKRLNGHLKRNQYDETLSIYSALKSRLKPLWETYSGLKEKIAAHPEDQEAQDYFEAFKNEIGPELEHWRAVQSKLQSLSGIVEKRNSLQHQLDDHPIAVARLKQEAKLRRDMETEAHIYAKLIITRWTRLGFCHRYTVKGKEKTDMVRFSNVSITHDAIYFKIAASHKTAFNNWDTDVPEGVYIAKQLLSPDTLNELSITCQKQVTGIYNANGAWVVVHRLESIDGLMNYVKFGDVMERYPLQYKKRMPIPVGVTYNREIQWVNLSDYPHWLIGGYTGSGKSNTINVGICSLISTQHPNDLRLILCDLKGGLEFSFYDGIPHLYGSIVDEPGKVAEMLLELESIMEIRFKQLKGVAKKIEDYQMRRPEAHMPRILCVFDEVASIQGHGDTTKQIVQSLLRLSRLGRAVGIHLWLCTQQPNVKVIEGGIKTNMNLRLSGRMPSTSDSITVLGNSSAAQLAAVAGRMIMQAGPDPLPIQTPHIPDEEISAALKTAKEFPEPKALEVGNMRPVHEGWSTQRLAEFSIKHMNGSLSGRYLFDAINDDSLTARQCYQLVEEIWKLGTIQYEGQQYIAQKQGKSWRLVQGENMEKAS